MRMRPKKHFTPENNWINDPNGLIFHDGQYHLFFQHNPFENKWGHMSWGHAVSTDLINWKELPVAIPEQADHAIFSGSAVFDEANNRLVAIYTGHREGNQSQYLSFSFNGGLTWSENLKVLDLNMVDFRDPKVFMYQDRWIMSVAKPKEFKVAFFESKDLINWKHLSDFHSPEITEIYECPDLFPLGEKWVLIISTNPGGLYGGSGSRYLIGQFDGKEFIPETKPEFLDYGPDPASQAAARMAPLAKVMRLEALWVISTRSPSSANITVCSPTMSPARMTEKPMLFGSRSPVWPSRPQTAHSLRLRPSASATTSPMRNAVPDGASTLWR